MTNKLYYQSKNPIACITFANWLMEHYDTHYGEYTIRVSSSLYLSNTLPSDAMFAKELYQIWENLEVDESMLNNEQGNV